MRNHIPLIALLIALGMPMEMAKAQAEKQELDAVQRGQDSCKQFGFKPGTADFAGCVQKEVWREKEIAQVQRQEETRANEVRRQEAALAQAQREQTEMRARELQRQESERAQKVKEEDVKQSDAYLRCLARAGKYAETWADASEERSKCKSDPAYEPTPPTKTTCRRIGSTLECTTR